MSDMEEVTKHINDTNASYRTPNAGDAKNTDLFLDNEHYELFKDEGEHIKVRYSKENLSKAILFIASILPRKYDNSSIHKTINYSPIFVYEQLEILDGFFKEDGKPVSYKTQTWNARKDVPKKNGEIDNRFYFNGLLEDFSYLSAKGSLVSSKFTIRNYLAGGYSDLHIKKADDGIFDVWVTNTQQAYYDDKEDGLEEFDTANIIDDSFQQIYYGAPGTGKSHTINKNTKGEEVIRTTFHPDTDYATFVGAYKPTTVEEKVMTVIGTKAVPVENADGSYRTESKIVYEFVSQAFLQAYVNAWKAYSEISIGEPRKQFLIIEEVNRGNCAQIFGDLFQLLDRSESGFSEYPVNADADIKRHLKKAFNGLNIAYKDNINAMYGERDIVKEVLNGDVLLLPGNFYIWATMNTSDQSLFPIDSAFKRRWDWKYMPISNGELGWFIEADKKKYDWWQFLCAINEKIGSTTSSEDKKLGYFFCKANSAGIISSERFVSKVIFYIWNDVFKDYEFADNIFNDPEGGKLSFDKFYTAEGENAKVIEKKVIAFLTNLGLKPLDDDMEPIDNDIPKSGFIIKVNDIEVKKYNAIPGIAVEEYVKSNQDKSAEEVASIWGKFVSCNPTSWFIVTDEGRKSLTARYANYSYEIKCSDGKSVWVNKDGWRRATDKNPRDTVQEFINAVNSDSLGIHIEEIKQKANYENLN